MLQTKEKPLTLSDGLGLRYRPLPGLDVADYLEEYMGRLEDTEVFGLLSDKGYGVDFQRLDAATVGLIGSALTKLLTGGSGQKMREYIIDHCKRFNVQAPAGDDCWVALADVDTINEHLSFDQMTEVVYRLGKEVLLPLFSRLGWSAGEKRPESETPSPELAPGS